MTFRVCLSLFLVALPVRAAPPSTLDRERLIAHLEMTESWLVDEVAHLSPAQLHFRPSPTSWSILDCVEHLTLAEPEYWLTYQKSMAAPAAKKGSPSDDLDRLWYGIDRTRRAQTIDAEVPRARFQEMEPALAEFRALRAKILREARTTQGDWRRHLVPEWDRDCYQWLLMISAHSQRHILQIREIRHSPGFPAS